MERTCLLITLILFAALSAVAMNEVGYVGIFMSPLQGLASMQIFVDLVIALTLVLVWMWRDAKATGRSIWPWMLVTLALGSFGPLLYLLTRRIGS